MSTAIDPHQAFHRGTAPVFAILTPEQIQTIAQLQGDPGLIDRLSELAEKSNEGHINDAERAEYEAYIEANDFLAVLQAEARFCLAKRNS